MYVGSKSLWGLINFVVSAYRILLAAQPNWIRLTECDGAIELCCDVELNIAGLDSSDDPLETIQPVSEPNRFDLLVLNALSADLWILSGDLRIRRQKGYRVDVPPTDNSGTTLRIVPDDEIFSIVQIPEAMIHSFLRRSSYLYDVDFQYEDSSGRASYRSHGGMRDLLDHVAAPYQLLHEPIHMRHREGEFSLELAFAFHSWNDSKTWSFVNCGRVPEGGLHETGMRASLGLFGKKILGVDSVRSVPGHIATMAIAYPDVTYQGCLKTKVGNDKLRTLTQQAVTNFLNGWAERNPSLIEKLRYMERFQMAELWTPAK